MQHATGVYFRNSTSFHYEVFSGIKIPMIFLFLSLFFNAVSGQEIKDEVVVVLNDSIVVLKKRTTSVSISVTFKNMSNADTLILKNVTGMLYPDLWYSAPGTSFFEKECYKNKLDFRIEDINGEIMQPKDINYENNTIEIDSNYYAAKQSSGLKDIFIRKRKTNDCLKRGSISLSQDSTVIVCPYLGRHYLSKGVYYLYIYYCNSYNTTYSLNYESALINTIPSAGRVPKKVFIGQFTSQPIKLIVK